MGGLAVHDHLELQAAVVGGDDGVGEAGADGEIGLGGARAQQIAGAQQPAVFLVVGEVQLDRAGERPPQRLERPKREGVGGEVGLGDGDAAAVHAPLVDDALVRWLAPAVARRHHVAVSVERDCRARPEASAHDQVGERGQSRRPHLPRRHGEALDCEAHGLQQGRGALRVGGVVAGRGVGRHAHQLAQERHLLLEAGRDQPGDLRLSDGRHLSSAPARSCPRAAPSPAAPARRRRRPPP